MSQPTPNDCDIVAAIYSNYLNGSLPTSFSRIPDKPIYDNCIKRQDIENATAYSDLFMKSPSDCDAFYAGLGQSSSVTPSSSDLDASATSASPTGLNPTSTSTPASETASRSNPPVAAIAGGVVGGLLLVVTAIIALVLLKKSRAPPPPTPTNDLKSEDHVPAPLPAPLQYHIDSPPPTETASPPPVPFLISPAPPVLEKAASPLFSELRYPQRPGQPPLRMHPAIAGDCSHADVVARKRW
ncbi:hypothetical protein HDU96_004763 [Phlyctochytrium bullatum]|nr:hypothetical protein HDU96_004763 [Phlyctochytrium bullatum]